MRKTHFDKPTGFLAECDATDGRPGSALYLTSSIFETLCYMRRHYTVTMIETRDIPTWAREMDAIRLRFILKI